MKFSRRFTVSCCVFMSTVMSNVPALAVASPSMIATHVVVDKFDRAKTQADVEGFLHREEVKKALLEHGVSADEISSRLASLSETELRQLSGQVHEARAGGDILITILLVVLIIFLVKRL